MVVAAYGLILPAWVLELPRAGLPEHPRLAAAALARRGADPARHRGRRRADRHHHHADGRRPGHRRMLLTSAQPIARRRHHRQPARPPGRAGRAAGRGGAGRCRRHGTPAAAPQPAEGVTYAHKIDKAEAAIDWRSAAAAIERRLRAFDPFPGASIQLGGAAREALARPRAAPCAQARPGRCCRAPTAAWRWPAARARWSWLEMQLPGGRRHGGARLPAAAPAGLAERAMASGERPAAGCARPQVPAACAADIVTCSPPCPPPPCAAALPSSLAAGACWLAGCDQLGHRVRHRRGGQAEAEGKAIGAGCRHAARSIETATRTTSAPTRLQSSPAGAR